MTMNMHICLSTTAVWGKISATPWVSLLCFDAYPWLWMFVALCTFTHESTCEFPFCHMSVSLSMLHNQIVE